MKRETLDEKVKRVLRDRIDLVPYDASWPAMFEEEKQFLLDTFPADLIRRVEHFGSTSGRRSNMPAHKLKRNTDIKLWLALAGMKGRQEIIRLLRYNRICCKLGFAADTGY